MDDNLVSIITPIFNSSTYIDTTIKSIIAQTYKNWELILIDDGSEDNSIAIIEPFIAMDKRIKLIKHAKNLGVASARNSGTKMAKGKFIAFLDSDDTWDKDKLRIQINFMQNNNCALSYTAYRKINTTGITLTEKIEVPDEVNYNSLLRHNVIAFLTSMYDVSVIGKRYFTNIGHEDFVFWLDILKENHIGLGINKVLASYRIHHSSLSHNKFKAAKYTWKIYRQNQKLPFLRSLYYFSNYMLNTSKKYLKK